MTGSPNVQLDKQLSAQSWGTLILLGLLMGLFAWAFRGHPGQDEAARRKARAEGLAYQVYEIRKNELKPTRGPASQKTAEKAEGRIGQDPTGEPYSYRILEEGNQWVVQIWSASQRQDPTEVRIQKDHL